MYFVYLIKSITFPNKTYIGYTKNLHNRLKEHNAGMALHTSKYMPWKLVSYLGFSEQKKAIAFEKYLKSGSGISFADKRLW